jgi:membrane associated rhomboid family serine protease
MVGILTRTLIILNIIVFLLVFSMPEEMMEDAFALLDFSGGSMLEIWRWFTSLFLHASASHLFFNMIALYFFGRVVEEEMKARRFLLIYFLSGLAGNLAYGFTSAEPAVGASGCIFGVMGAAMLLKPKEMIRLYFIPLPLGLIAILYILTQAALAVIPLSETGIAYMAHIGGLLAGSAMAFYFEPRKAVKGVAFMILLLALLVVLWPLIGFVVTVGHAVLSVIDFVVGLVLYGVSKLLLSWIW